MSNTPLINPRAQLSHSGTHLALEVLDLAFPGSAHLHHVLKVRVPVAAVVLPLAQHIHRLLQLLLKPHLPVH